MATESIVGGLFGMTPEAYQLQQSRQDLARAAELGQMDPFSSARTSLIYGGSQLGRMFGGEDPQLQLISARNAVMREIDQTDPESIIAGARKLQQIGDTQGAFGLQELAQKRAESSASISLKEAQAQKAREWQAATTASERNRKLIADADVVLAEGGKLTPAQESNLRVQIANELKPKITDIAGTKYQIDPMDINLAAPNVAKYFGIQGAGTATGATGAGATGTGVGIREIPTAAGQEEKISQAEAMTELFNRTKNIKDIISESKGLISNYTTGYGSFLSVLPLTDARTLQNNIETIKSNLAFAQLQALKEAAKTGASGLGSVTRNEFEALQSTIAKLDPQSKNFASDLDRVEKAYTRLLNQLEGKTERAERRAGVSQTAKPEVPGLTSSDVAPRQSPFSGVNPQLQPEVETKKTVKKWSEL